MRFPAAYGFDQLCGTAVWEMALEASELCSKEMQLIVLKSLLQIVRPHHPILIYVANCAAVVFLVQRYISAASTLCNKFRLKGREDVSSSPNNNTLYSGPSEWWLFISSQVVEKSQSTESSSE